MRKVFIAIGLLLGLGLVWFLFIKKYDYQFQMETKYGPAIVFHEVSKLTKLSESNNQKISLTKKAPFKNITQLLENGNSDIEMFWEFEKKNDSVTDVTINVLSNKDQLSNRLQIINPFRTSNYIQTLKKELLAFNRHLKEGQEGFKIRTDSAIVMSPNLDCICHSSSNIPVDEKALQMVRTIPYLENYVKNFELKLTGFPFVKITAWDRDRDIIDFDFCFPVNLAQNIKPVPGVEFKQVKSFSALKAEFNGNYRLTDLAWYELLYRAEEEGLETNALPLEVFHNNPQDGGDPLEWQADIYLPILK